MVTCIITQIGYYVPIDNTNLALCPVVGLLFGPFGALGVDTISLVENLIKHPDRINICILDFLTTFLVSYIPYRLWYSTFLNGGSTRPTLNSVRNVFKFIAVLAISAISYTILYNLTYGLIDGSFEIGFDDITRLMNVSTFSFIYGFGAVILMRYLGIELYAPRGSTSEGWRTRIDPNVYNLFLIIGILFPLIVLTIYPTELMISIVTQVTYVLFMLFLLKPVKQPVGGITTHPGKDRFNNSLIERIIVMFLVSSILICTMSVVCTRYGILGDVLGVGMEKAILFYMGASLMTFFIPMVLSLWYVDRRITTPLMAMSRAAEGFITSSDISENAERAKTVYVDYHNENSEIGKLATSLTKMTDDMESYVNNIRELRGKQEKIEAEMSLAQAIQRSLIPMDFDSVEEKGPHIFASMTPARFVGGDLYHFFMVDEDHLAFIVADVSGKGVPASLFMAITKSLIEGHAMSGHSPEDIMSHVNNGLCNDRDIFVTAWLGIMDITTGKVEFVNAGHNPPVLRRKGAASEYLKTRPGLVLGGMKDMVYKRYEIQLKPGDRILLYTDGVTEANVDYGGFYGEDRLLRMLDLDRNRSVKDDVEFIRNDVISFMKGSDQFDDITILEVEYVGKG